MSARFGAPPPGLVWDDEESSVAPIPRGGSRPTAPPPGLVWDDTPTPPPAPSLIETPVAPPAGPPSPAGNVRPAGFPLPAGGATLRPGSLQPEPIMPASNPLRDALLAQRIAGRAPLAVQGPAAVQAAAAPALAPLPEVRGDNPAAQIGSQWMGASAGAVSPMVRAVPEEIQRARTGLVDTYFENLGKFVLGGGKPLTAEQRARLDFAKETMQKILPVASALTPFGVGNDVQADVARKVDDAVVRPAERFWQGTDAAKDYQARTAGQTTGEALRDPVRWGANVANALPSLGLMAASPEAAGVPLAMMMEGGAKLREEEDRERRTGKKSGDLRVAAVSALTGIGNGLLERWGWETAVGKVAEFLPKTARRGFLSTLAKATEAALAEGGTEGLQQVLPNLYTKALIDSSQTWDEGVLDSIMGGFASGGALGGARQAGRVAEVQGRLDRMNDRRAWNAEMPAPEPTPAAERTPAKPETADERLGRLKLETAALEARLKGLKSRAGIDTSEGILPGPVDVSERSSQRAETADEHFRRLIQETAALDAQLRDLKRRTGFAVPEDAAPARGPEASAPTAPLEPFVPMGVGDNPSPGLVEDILNRNRFGDMGARVLDRSLGDAATQRVRERRFRDATAAAERQRIIDTPGAAARLVLGEDPAFLPEPAPERATAPGETGMPERRRVGMPVLDWIDEQQRSGVDEDRRTAPPEEWSHDESRYFAITDAGTGLPNRLAYEIASKQAPEAHHAVLDVDGLKKFNDTYGHETGDDYLAMVGLTARQNGVRLFRVGGDEFTAIHDGDPAALEKLLEQTRRGLEATQVPVEGAEEGAYPLHRGFSYGVGRDFKTADARAYEDKRRRKGGDPAGAGAEVRAEPVGVGSSQRAEASPGPGSAAGVPPPVRKPRGGPGGDQGAPPAGPATLPPPVAPPASQAPPAARQRASEPAPAAAPPRPAAAPNPAPSSAAFERTGREGEAFTPDGERVGVKWAVADAFDDVVASHDENATGDLTPNPAFAQVLQPRDRGRAASEQQVERISRELRPAALGESHNASDGAPIVGPDRLVESGNGRTLAVRRAYRTGRGEEYRRWLEEHAADFGLTADQVREVKAPMLVRVRTTPTADRADLVKKFNVPTVARMSAAEAARADADRLTPTLLSRFQPGEDALAILSARNRDFVAGFLATIPENERSELLDEDGQLNKDGRKRIENALLGKAYGRSPILERITESTDDNTRLVSGALLNAAPKMATLKGAIEKGDVRADIDPTPAVVEAVQKLSWLRDEGGSVESYLQQSGLFGDEMSPAGREVLQAFDDFRRSGRKLTSFLTSVAESAILEGDARQQSLLEDAPAARLEDVVRAARRFASDGGQQTLSSGGEDLPLAPPDGPSPGGVPGGRTPGAVDRPRVSLAGNGPASRENARQTLLVERYARRISRGWSDAPSLTVVSTEAGLPSELRALAGDSRVEGVYVPKEDKVYLVAGSLSSRADVERVVLHEVMGHAGLRRLLGRDRFASVMDGIATSLPDEVAAKAKAYSLDLSDEDQRREAADEVLAEWASRGERQPSVITRALATIRGWLREVFPSLKWTPADVRSLLAEARTRVEVGPRSRERSGEARFSRLLDGGEQRAHLEGDVREQLDLFSPDERAHAGAAEARRSAEDALRELSGDRGGVAHSSRGSRGLEGAGIRTRADVFAGLLRRRGVDFRGTRVASPADLAVAARVVRDPRLETIRLFYVKDNRVVGHEAWTSRMPTMVGFSEERLGVLEKNMRRRMERFGADGWWLLHNHPSGDPTPSGEDENFAKQLAGKVNGFLGSVVIDHETYGVVTNQLSRGGAWIRETYSLPRDRGESDLAELARETLPKAQGPQDLAELGRRYHRGKGIATVFYLDARLRVVGVQDVPMGRMTKEGAVDFFRGQVRRFGAAGIGAYFVEDPDTGNRFVDARRYGGLVSKLRPLFSSGILYDAVGERRGSMQESGLAGTAWGQRFLGLPDRKIDARKVGEEPARFAKTTSSAAEDRIYQTLVDRARARAAEAAQTAARVRQEIADPGDILEARRDPDLPEHSREIQRHIRPVGRKAEVVPLLNPAEEVYQKLVRRHYAIEKAASRLGATERPAHEDPGIVAELAAGHAARAEQFLEGNGGFRLKDGGIEWTGNRSLSAILDTLGPGRLNDLRRYLVARRAIELHHRSGPQLDLSGDGEQTIYSGISEASAQQEVSGAPEDVKRSAEEVTALLDDALRYWAESGGLSPAAVDVIRDLNRSYVPFYRVFENQDPAKKSGRLILPAQRGAALQAEQAVKRIFGGGADILDPLVAVVDHIQRMVRAADLNRVGKTLVEAAALNPAAAAGLVEEVPQPGADPDATREGQAVQDAAGAYGVDVDDEAASAIGFLSDKKLGFENDRIRVWREGKLKEYRVEKSIGEALRALGPDDPSFFGKLLSLPSRMLRSGVTKNPIFALHNFARDTGDASVQTRNGFRPFIDSAIGLREAIRNGELRREWLASGGGYATLAGGGIKGAEAALKEIAPKTVGQSVVRTFRHPLEVLGLLNRPFEEATRLGEYRLARQRGKSATEGSLDAARVTTNFTVHGTDPFWWGLAKASAFVNPAIQGTDKAFRTVLEAPRGKTLSASSVSAAAANVAFKGLLYVGSLSALFYLLGDDDDEIKELRRTKAGAAWWHARIPGTKTIVRFPKPFLWGQVFGTGVEAALDRARGENPGAYKEWRREVLGMLADNVLPIPTVVKASGELLLNRSLYYQRPIVPRSLENVEPRYQAGPSTSQLARKAGDVLNLSPSKIEYGVSSIGGTLGREALRAGDLALGDGKVSPPSPRIGDLPLVGRAFARTPDTSGDSMETFYEDLEQTRKAVATMKNLRQENPEEARRRAPEYRHALLAARGYEETAKALADYRKTIERIRTAPDARFSRDEKRERIDALVNRMNLLARRVVEKRLLEERPQ